MPNIPVIVSQKKKTIPLITYLPHWISIHKYWLTAVSFLVYMYFFDQYRIPVALKIYSNLTALEKERDEFLKLIVKVRDDKRDFENNYEKFAREKYYMSKSDEDVFIIEKQ